MENQPYQTEYQPQAQFPPPQKTTSKLSKKTIIIIGIVAIILFAATVIICIILSTRRAEQNTQINTNNPNSTNTARNYDGEGYSVVVIDTGVNKSHVALQGKIIDEICVGYAGPITDAYGRQLANNLCPKDATPVARKGNINIYRAVGAATDCTPLVVSGDPNANNNVCMHGTAVAAAVTMSTRTFHNPALGDIVAAGIAPGAKIIAVQFGSLTPPKSTNEAPSISLDSNLAVAAMEYIADNYNSFSLPIASVNYSVADDKLSASDHASCRATAESKPESKGLHDDYSRVFAKLKNLGIATVAGGGNTGNPYNEGAKINAIGFPACVENAIAVGATDITGKYIASYTQNAPITALLSTGGDGDELDSLESLWFPSGQSTTEYRSIQGTSIATPFVAGAFATLRQKYPDASVDRILKLLETTGSPVNDTRPSYTVGSKPLINLDAALNYDLNKL
jgi:hypothetical protein